jgi:hypothetical protein
MFHLWFQSVLPEFDHYLANYFFNVRFGIFTAVTMKNAVFWEVRSVALVSTDVPPKRRFIQEPYDVTSHKMEFLILLQLCNSNFNVTTTGTRYSCSAVGISICLISLSFRAYRKNTFPT